MTAAFATRHSKARTGRRRQLTLREAGRWRETPSAKSERRSRKIIRPRCSRDLSVWSLTWSTALASSVERPCTSRSSTGNPVDGRQLHERLHQALPELPSHHLVVGQRRPVRDVAQDTVGDWFAPDGGQGQRAARAIVPDRAQARHGRVEGDPVYPGRERGIPAKRLDLLVNLEEHVLDHLVCVFGALQVAQGELADAGRVARREVGNSRLVAGFQPFDEGLVRR